MKILIVSDTHRYNENYLKALEKEAPIDMLIHCGDVEGSEYLYAETAHCPIHMVSGNNDFFSSLNREGEFMIGQFKVFLTHGHAYNISMGNELLLEEGRARGADIVMFGHTHRPMAEVVKGIYMVNPGSLTYPRQEGRRPSYIVMNTDEKKDLSFTIKYL